MRPIPSSAQITLSLLLAAGLTSASLAVAAPRAALPVRQAAASRASITPWQTCAGGTKRVKQVLPPKAAEDYVPKNAFRWAPPPDRRWAAAPNPTSIDWNRREETPCEEGSAYIRYRYFRTRLKLPPGLAGRPARFIVASAGDVHRVTVNGRDLPPTAPPRVQTMIGPLLHAGDNEIVVALADWCGLSFLKGARIEIQEKTGRWTATGRSAG